MTDIITIFPESRTEPITIIPSPPKTLRDELREQGWKLAKVIDNGKIIYAYTGKFKGNWRQFDGFVWRDESIVYIKDLPNGVRNGPHRPCFSPTIGGWFYVHFNWSINPLARICALENHLKEMGE